MAGVPAAASEDPRIPVPDGSHSVQVFELTLHYTQHCDHNVVTAALELLQQVLRTPPPELLGVLVTPGSVQRIGVSREEAESRARSGSILELIGKWPDCISHTP